MPRLFALRLAAVTALYSVSAFAAPPDNLSIAVDTANAVGTNPLGSFTYDPISDTMYTHAFRSATGPTILRKITGAVDGTEVSTGLVTETDIALYYREGDGNRSQVNAGMQSIQLNPKAFSISTPDGNGGTITTNYPARSVAFIVDSETTKLPGGASMADDPTVSKRIYRWNLQATPAAAVPPPPYGDARDVMTTLATTSTWQNATNPVSASTTNTNISRQFAYSGDGKALYIVDSQATFGGIWKLNVENGALSRLLTATVTNARFNSEPGRKTLANGSDRILFAGTIDSGNAGGISYIEHDGINTGTIQTLYTKADAIKYLGVNATNGIDVASMTVGHNDTDTYTTDNPAPANPTGDTGDIYFSDGGTGASIWRLDRYGRASKFVSRAERDFLRSDAGKIGTITAGALRLQFIDNRSVTVNGNTFKVPRVMWAEQGQNYVIQALGYKPGDFDRDNDVDADDIALFKPVLTARNVLKAKFSTDYKFDMAGISVNAAASGTSDFRTIVDWQDVKNLQQFYAFRDGDADINGTVDTVDFAALIGGFGGATRTWLTGDFSGDDATTSTDFNILVANYGLAAPTLPDAVPGPLPGFSVVPEPASLSLIGGVGFVIIRRRRK